MPRVLLETKKEKQEREGKRRKKKRWLVHLHLDSLPRFFDEEKKEREREKREKETRRIRGDRTVDHGIKW